MENVDTLFVTAILWAGWCALHSLLISQRVTEWMAKHLRERFAFYRMGYVLFSIATVMPVVVYTYTVRQRILFDWAGPWRLLEVLLAVYALAMFYGGVRVYDLKYFVGISQLRAYFAGRRQQEMEFATNGVLRFVRHPWYSGGIAFVCVFGPVTDVSLVARIVLSLYLIIGALLEERKLLAAIGKPYRNYQQEVPMLVPVLWKRRAKGG